MFYSHEILTRREHGVATIWLVATLGSKSSLKKVTRKAINDVDVPQAVQTIVSPDAPMALRLQGNLLYGVSRVYSQQCSYVHSDLQSFWDKLRHSSLALGREGMEIDPEAGRARPEQLNLQDDPAFMPDFDINLDLSLFDLPVDRSFSGTLNHIPSLAGSSHASLSDHELQLELPSDETPGLGIGGFDFGARTSSVGGPLGSNFIAPSIFEEPGIIDDPEFDIDADGNLFTPAQLQRQSDVAQSALASLGVPGSKVRDSTGITDRVRAEHEAGLHGHLNDQAFDFDDQPMFMGDDEPLIPDAESFSARHASSAPRANQAHRSSSAHPELESSSIIEVAPQRRIRSKPAIKVDYQTQLHNNVLKAWDTNYLQNMAAEQRKRTRITSNLTEAKKNAEKLILAVGLSGLGREFDFDVEHPLRQAFSGQAMFDLLTGGYSSPAGKKRAHVSDEGEETDEEGRRVRPRGDDEQEIGRGEDGQYQFDDGDGILAQGDDDLPIEIGRHAPASMPDIDSVRDSMPWNILSSRAGSARPAGLTSSIGALAGGFDPALGPPSIRGHRLTSASPLFGRGKHVPTRYSTLEIPGPSQPRSQTGVFDDDDFQLPDIGDDRDDAFELHGPAAGVSTQQADNSQWLATTLEDEANNFFAFLHAEIEQRHPVRKKTESQDRGSGAAHGDGESTVTFEELLPPARNSKVVGAQGLLHVLTLVTKGAVVVTQHADFGDIEMSIVPGVRLVERLDDDGDEKIVEEIGMDEQVAAEPDQGGDDGDDEDEDMYG